MTLEEQLAPTVRPPPPTIPAPADKACSCCGAVYDHFDWTSLATLGVKLGLEWKNCPRCNSTLAVETCSVDECSNRALYVTDEGAGLCAGHEREWHMLDDREDFADEWAREERRDYASAAE